ncbi:hypothetical protein KVR01_004127 [Diaporthe batatas]|uniref:uncharacterized protein n=1 Tax=Diaporthe batatas TaxID=748121 RepID=UPI001D03B985|nr:uncharacterized protein KVR01_004127 [Diaporthe batatas]KAG8165575.1 hypothetical protein KVR01_004127 [Diaporthe batatas]
MKVIIIGASGATGGSIVNGLLESTTQFEITAVTREASLNSKNNDELRSKGVKVVAADLKGPEADLVNLLKGADVVISAIVATALLDQIPLANAAKKAGVGRFIPCTFATACPPAGVMKLRDTKETVLNHIKKIYLPYTLIDVGWWYQISAPRVPSGRADSGLLVPVSYLVGDGSVPSALTDVKDIGRYVAKIIADPRTLNRMVFAHSEVLSQKQIFDKVEELSGEKLERNYLSAEALQAQIDGAFGPDGAVPEDTRALQMLWSFEYQYSWGIRGDNTPENAKYLGYLLGKELYPDMEFTSYESYIKSLLDGTATRPYA